MWPSLLGQKYTYNNLDDLTKIRVIKKYTRSCKEVVVALLMFVFFRITKRHSILTHRTGSHADWKPVNVTLIINEKGPPSSHALHTCTERDEKQEAKNRFFFVLPRLSVCSSWFLTAASSKQQFIVTFTRTPLLFVSFLTLNLPFFFNLLPSVAVFSFHLLFLNIPPPYHLLISLLCFYILTYHLYILNLCNFFFVVIYHCVSLWALDGCWLLPLCSRWSTRPLFPAHKAPGCHSRRPWHVLAPSPSDACAQRWTALRLYCWAVRASLTLCYPLLGLQFYVIILSHPIHAGLFGSAFETEKKKKKSLLKNYHNFCAITNPDSRLLIIRRPLF